MTPNQILLVKTSFAKIEPIADTAAGLFYARLFELDPALKDLFMEDIGEQGRKLMAMIGLAVRGLDDLPALLPVVQALGRRHLGYGVEDADYRTVGAALLWTLEKGLGKEFTSETRDAWATMYGVLSDTMRGSASVSEVGR